MSFFKNVLNKTNGKLAKLEILPRSGAEELVYSPQLLAGGIVLASGASWDEIIISDRSGQVEDNSEVLRGGVLTAFRVGGNIAKITRETAAMLYQNQGNPFYLRVTLIDGTVLLLSDMKLESKLTHGQLVRDFSGFRINFASRTATPPLFYTEIPKLGDTGPGQGIIFHVDTVHHLVFEVWKTHSAEKPWETMLSFPTDLNTLQDVGAGRQNTDLALEEFSEDTIFNELGTFSGGDKTDWHIPSILEMKALVDYLHLSGKVNPFTELVYLSSSQKNATEVYVIDMTTREPDYADKLLELRTLFVRMYPLFP